MELSKLKKIAALSLGLHLSDNKSKKVAAAYLAVHLSQNKKCSNVQKAALIGLLLYLNNKESKPVSSKDVAVAALAYHLQLEERKLRALSNPQFIVPSVSTWAFKGFLMRQVPNKISRQSPSLR